MALLAILARGANGVPTKSVTLWGEEAQRSGRIVGACACRSIAEFVPTRGGGLND